MDNYFSGTFYRFKGFGDQVFSCLRQDLDKAYSLIPGNHRLNLHAMYHEAGKAVPRNEIRPEPFANWVAWAKENNHGVDFNPSCFSHPLADDGFTLASADEGIRNFWIVADRGMINAETIDELETRCISGT